MMNVKVFKFGGASVDTAARIRNVASILEKHKGQSVMVVISAMGKTTNALENLLRDYIGRDPVSMVEKFYRLKDFHSDIVHELFENREHPVFADLELLFEELRVRLQLPPESSYDETYDQVIPYGELFSCLILHQP
jgi:aspartate kinase